MIWPLLAVVLTSGPEVHAYNPNAEEAWCAAMPVPKAEGLAIPKDGGWRAFPSRPAWCSPGVVIETPKDHKTHGTRGECPLEAAMWDVALRKTEQQFREGK